MEGQANFVERCEHPQVGLMAQLEDTTYSALGKYGVDSDREAPVVCCALDSVTSPRPPAHRSAFC
jgi:hypothetical protein